MQPKITFRTNRHNMNEISWISYFWIVYDKNFPEGSIRSLSLFSPKYIKFNDLILVNSLNSVSDLISAEMLSKY